MSAERGQGQEYSTSFRAVNPDLLLRAENKLREWHQQAHIRRVQRIEQRRLQAIAHVEIPRTYPSSWTMVTEHAVVQAHREIASQLDAMPPISTYTIDRSNFPERNIVVRGALQVDKKIVVPLEKLASRFYRKAKEITPKRVKRFIRVAAERAKPVAIWVGRKIVDTARLAPKAYEKISRLRAESMVNHPDHLWNRLAINMLISRTLRDVLPSRLETAAVRHQDVKLLVALTKGANQFLRVLSLFPLLTVPVGQNPVLDRVTGTKLPLFLNQALAATTFVLEKVLGYAFLRMQLVPALLYGLAGTLDLIVPVSNLFVFSKKIDDFFDRVFREKQARVFNGLAEKMQSDTEFANLQQRRIEGRLRSARVTTGRSITTHGQFYRLDAQIPTTARELHQLLIHHEADLLSVVSNGNGKNPPVEFESGLFRTLTAQEARNEIYEARHEVGSRRSKRMQQGIEQLNTFLSALLQPQQQLAA